jgi:A118 family predicted phage portal protein
MQKRNSEGTLIAIQKPSLQMAKKVGEDLTSLLFNENVQLSVDNKKAQERLDYVLEQNNFYDEMPNFVELTAAPYGTGVLIEYIADAQTKLNYLFGDRVYVIDYNNTTVKGVAVVQEFQQDKHKYTHVMYLTMVEGKYRIQHEMYSTKEGNKGIGNPTSLEVLFSEAEMKKLRHVKTVDNVQVVEYYTEYETDTPHFQVFKLAIANNYDVKSPLGISMYANSISTLENIDEKYYSSRMESINKRVRLFIDDEASKLQRVKNPKTGTLEYKKYFDPDETQFQTLKGMSGDGTQKAIEIFAPTYDIEMHDKGIQAELNYLSLKCLGSTNYYQFEGGAVGYQNELNTISSNSDLYRFRQKNLNKLECVLVNMMKSILFLEKELGNYNGNLDLDYKVQFDDDIMTDDKSKLEQLRLDVQDGFLPEYMYIMEAYKVDETEAKRLLQEADTSYEEPEEEIDGNEE